MVKQVIINAKIMQKNKENEMRENKAKLMSSVTLASKQQKR